MNFLHDLIPGDPESLINVVVEIPMGSNIKYEYDQELGIIKVDRFLYTAFSYPFNYGFIPQTLGHDSDPIDILVINQQPLLPGSLIECRIIGMLESEDEAGGDTKIVAVPGPKIDPSHENTESLEQIPESTKNKIAHFYEMYKSLEPGKWVKVVGWKDQNEAIATVKAGILAYQNSRL